MSITQHSKFKIPDPPAFLFLDRDGVINERLPDRYISSVSEFIFTEGALAAIADFRNYFDRIIIVTNQQGIGKGIMTRAELDAVHAFMKSEIEKASGKIDGIYFCPDLSTEDSWNRKPNPGMAFEAKNEFPEIDFTKSILIGDSNSDLLFGKRLGMKTIFIRSNPDEVKKVSMTRADYSFESLKSFSKVLSDA